VFISLAVASEPKTIEVIPEVKSEKKLAFAIEGVPAKRETILKKEQTFIIEGLENIAIFIF